MQFKNAISKASETIKNLHWFEVVDTRGYIKDGRVHYRQITNKIGFKLED